jgi:hypothetical protein
VWEGIDSSLNYFTRSSWGKWVSRTNDADDEAKIAKVWPSERPHSKLGLVITMVGHGIWVQLVGLFFLLHTWWGKDDLACFCARFFCGHYKRCEVSCFVRVDPCPSPLALQFLCHQINILLLVYGVCIFVDVIANPTWVDLVSWVVLSCGVAMIIMVHVKDGLYRNRFPMDMFILLMIEVFKSLHQ